MKHRAVHNPRPKLRNPSPEKLDVLLALAAKPALPISAGAIEARRLIAEAQLKYKQQQENAVNAVVAQNERVKAALSEWGDDEDKPTQTTKENAVKPNHFQPTNNVTRETFNFVRDNPGKNTKQITTTMSERGFNASSVASLLGQMRRTCMIDMDEPTRTYHALTKEYQPMKLAVLKADRAQTKKKSLSQTIRKLALKHAPIKPDYPERQTPTVNIDLRFNKNRNAPEGIATLNAAHAQATPAIPVAAPTPKLLTAAQVLETLSIKEAHILYRELQTMFG